MKKRADLPILFLAYGTEDVLHKTDGTMQNVYRKWDAYLEENDEYRGMRVKETTYTKDMHNVINGIDAVVGYLEDDVDTDNEIRVNSIQLVLTRRIDGNTILLFDDNDQVIALFCRESGRCKFITPEWSPMKEWFRRYYVMWQV